jgi:AAHS family 4-hydroxybenzoate transporter-like MFS transporter
LSRWSDDSAQVKRNTAVLEKNVKQSSIIDVRQFINERPMSPYQWLILSLCFLIVAVDGVDVAIMGFIAPSVIKEWDISKAAFGVVMSAAPFGLVIGALVAGPLSDKVGRKLVLTASVLTFGLFTVATAYAHSTTEMTVMRLLTGVGLGAAMPNASTLLTEYVPERSRALLVTIMFTGFNLGSALVGFLAAAVLPGHGWRTVLLIGGLVPVVLTPILVLLLPESCRFMAVKGYPAQRIATVLQKVSGQPFVGETTFMCAEPGPTEKAPVKQLFAKGYRFLSSSLWVTYFMGLMVIYLLTGWLPTLFKENGLSMADAANTTAMFQIGGTVGAVVVGWLMGKGSPTKVIGLAYLGGAVCVGLLGLSGAVPGTLAVWVTLAGFCMSGAQTGLNAHAPSCYPTSARATGVSWMLGVGRFGSILGSLVGGVLLGLGWGFGPILMLLAVPALVAALAIGGAQRVKALA